MRAGRSRKPAEAGSGVMAGRPGERATRIDRERGIRQDMEFFGAGDARMFGALHVPLGEAIGGVLICSPLGIEHVSNHRNEVLLSNALAARGIAAQRFDYRGWGNSEGEPGASAFETMRDDALEAASHLRERAGVTALGFLGIRWGGLIAAAVAAAFPASPLALWEPTADARSYFRDVYRWRLTRYRSDGEATEAAGDPLVEELERTGSVDLFGFPLARSLYRSAVDRSLSGELGGAPRPVLLVQVGWKESLRKEYAALTQGWTAVGFAVATHVIGGQKPWWFPGMRPEGGERMSGQTVPIEVTTEWLAGRLADAGRRSA